MPEGRRLAKATLATARFQADFEPKFNKGLYMLRLINQATTLPSVVAPIYWASNIFPFISHLPSGAASIRDKVIFNRRTNVGGDFSATNTRKLQ
ncbi:MAG: hypothetical protein AB1393_01475 [Candidatus Edwardsbacteria bacterium]